MSEDNSTRVIKRYGNRKLYDTEASRYVTLEQIARLVRGGKDIKVIDNENGDDLTTITFAQIILEEEKRHSGLLPLGLLRELIRHGEDALAELRSRVDKGIEALGTIGEKAGRRVQEIVSGRAGGEEHDSTNRETGDSMATEGAQERVAREGAAIRGFFDELLAGPQRRLEAIQRSIDERIKSSVGRITGHPAFQKEVRRIERSIKKLEERLARLRREEIKAPPGSGEA